MEIRRQHWDFVYGGAFTESPQAYERLILDAARRPARSSRGSHEEVEALVEVPDPILSTGPSQDAAGKSKPERYLRHLGPQGAGVGCGHAGSRRPRLEATVMPSHSCREIR